MYRIYILGENTQPDCLFTKQILYNRHFLLLTLIKAHKALDLLNYALSIVSYNNSNEKILKRSIRAR
jgi:hypothetical protein